MVEWKNIEVDDPNMFRLSGPVPTHEYELDAHKTGDGRWGCRLHRFKLGHDSQRVEPQQGHVVGEFTAQDAEDAKLSAEALIKKTRY